MRWAAKSSNDSGIQMSNPSQYHLTELKIALDSTDPRHVLPPPAPASARVLDVGCGAGQSLIAFCGDRLSFGLDIDMEALRLGKTLTDRVAFACCRAEAIPLRSQSFDVVITRVTLPLTNMPESLPEIRRVLRAGGMLWMTLHPFSIPWRAARRPSPRAWGFFLYVLINSLLYHCYGRQISFFGKRYESFQTENGIRRALERLGFRQISVRKSGFFIVTAFC